MALKPGQWRFITFMAIIALTIFSAHLFRADSGPIHDFLNSVPLALQAVIFILLFVAGTFVVVLKDPLRLIAAVLYGPYLSTILIYAGEMINVVLLFNLSKVLGRGYIESRLEGRSQDIYRRLEELDFWQLLMLRLLPFTSYRVLDLSAGLTRIPLRRYLAAAAVGSLPRLFWIQYPLAAVGSIDLEKLQAYFLSNIPLLLGYALYTVIVLVVAVVLYVKIFLPPPKGVERGE